ncbi:cation transporter [Streptococcus parauberis]|nr:cation transporter [Streptococcus parauberis]
MGKKKNNGMGSVTAALLANLVVAISKFVAFLFSGLTAMMNESIHSLVDCGNQVLLLIGDKKSKNLASSTHPFGETRAKYFYSTVVAMMLFFGGGALGIMEAIKKIAEGNHSIENPYLVLIVLVFGVIVEGSSLRVAFKEIKELNNDNLPILKFLRESRHSEIIIVFAEDFCAVVGLAMAFIGTILSMVTHNSFYDTFSGLLIGIMLCLVAVLLAKEFYGLLIGESVTDTDLKIIESAFEYPDVQRVIDIKTIHLSAIDILITAKIELTENHITKSSHLINQIEATIRQGLTDEKAYIYIELDQFDENYSHPFI